ncbi:MAG: hypothetical protein EXR43_04435 [Dehalococcoidia bacterium]|nr:hypothetical protein [Dehalococcoidia bacterium]
MVAYDPVTGGPLEGEIELRGSAVGDVCAHEVEIEQGAVFAVRADQVKMDRSASVLVAAHKVEAQDVRTVLLLTPRLRGNVTALIDLRTAVAIGAGFFLARAALRLAAGATRWLVPGRRRSK